MASPVPRPQKSPRKTSPERRAPSAGRPPATFRGTPESVDPIWLVKAFGVIVLASLICGYLSLCLLFYQGQWQLVLHPSRSIPAPVSIGGAPIQTIHFAVDESAMPQLTGWWVPAEPLARYAGYTVLYLPSGDGSLAGPEDQQQLAVIHSLGLNLFAFDYRGYGQSAAVHPNQRRMTQDAASAWKYLTISRAFKPDHLVLFGNAVGCFLAVQLAAQHPEVPAIVLDSPRPDLLDVVLADPRVKSLPVRALFHERFDIAQATVSMVSPKLFLLNDIQNAGRGRQQVSDPSQLQSLVDQAGSPKRTAHLTSADRADGVYSGQVSRFLDEYLR